MIRLMEKFNDKFEKFFYKSYVGMYLRLAANLYAGFLYIFCPDEISDFSKICLSLYLMFICYEIIVDIFNKSNKS